MVAAVPRARHGAGHTLGFDQAVAWLATVCSKTAVTELMRIAWRGVGGIIARVWADTTGRGGPAGRAAPIGIDEISYRKGHKYLVVVVDHDSGRLVWAARGADKASLGAFLDLLGPDRCAQISHVSSDSAPWMSEVIAGYCPRAVRCADAYHVVTWATEALDEQRRHACNAARGAARGRSPQQQADRGHQGAQERPLGTVGGTAAAVRRRRAHELRSPLAGLRYCLEVAVAHPEQVDLPQVVRRALADTERLQRLAEDLLLLARLTDGTAHRTVPWTWRQSSPSRSPNAPTSIPAAHDALPSPSPSPPPTTQTPTRPRPRPTPWTPTRPGPLRKPLRAVRR